MKLEDLKGFWILSCTFSKSSYSFDFCGSLNGQHKTFVLSTSYCFSLTGEKRRDARENFSAKVWDCMECGVVDVTLREMGAYAEATFLFENGNGFVIWSDEPLDDNLLIWRDQFSEDWGVWG